MEEKGRYYRKLTKYSMMIVGKYFRYSRDFINVMKVSKKFKFLTQMYHFNPIQDYSLFENMETQYLYNIYRKEKKTLLSLFKKELPYKKEGMKEYVYWYHVNYEDYKNRQPDEIYKRVEVHSEPLGYRSGHFGLPIEYGDLVVPEGVTLISYRCFWSCTALTHVSLPSTLLEIGCSAFSHSNIGSITIPEGVTSIGNSCFEGCKSLMSIDLPSSLVSIGKSAFDGSMICEINIPEGITRYDCKVPMFVREILEKKGIKCTNYYLDKEDMRRAQTEGKSGMDLIPEGITSVPYHCFYENKLTSVTLPSSIVKISANAFEQSGIHSIIIPEGVTSIEDDGFSYSMSLTSVQLPSTIVEIGKYAFYSTKITTLTIPEGITYIANNCFGQCKSLTGVQLPSTLVRIDDWAFSNSGITSIIIPEGVTSLGFGCFDGCKSLTSVQLPSSLTSIGESAFSSKYEAKVPMKQVEVPKNCKIGKHAFEDDCKVIRK